MKALQICWAVLLGLSGSLNGSTAKAPSSLFSQERNINLRRLSPKKFSDYWFKSVHQGDIAGVKNCLRAKSPETFLNEREFEKYGSPCLRDTRWVAALHIAAEKGDTDIVRLLLQQPKIDVNIKEGNNGENTPLYFALENQHNDIVNLLLQNEKIDVSTEVNGGPLLWLAAQNGNKEVVEMLLAHPGIDVNELAEHTRSTPLAIAAAKGHTGIVQLLLDHPGIEINKGSRFPLNEAALCGKIGVVHLLLQQPDIDINMKEYMGQTPLCSAIIGKHSWEIPYKVENNLPIIKLLLAYPEIDINLPDNNGWTPLHWACSASSNANIVELLLQQPGIDVNAKSKANITPLHCAEFPAACKLLEREDIDVNAQDEKGMTPLHRASLFGEAKKVNLLLQDPRVKKDLKNKKGQTPREIAKTREIRALFDSYEASVHSPAPEK